MRILLLTLVFLGFNTLTPAMAADEFGARFGDSAAPAFSDPAPQLLETDASALQNIEPAAGVEDTDPDLALPSDAEMATSIDSPSETEDTPKIDL